MSDNEQLSPEQHTDKRAVSSIVCHIHDLAGLHLRGWAHDQASL